MFRHSPQDLSATSSNLSGVKDPDVPSGPPEEMDISVILPVSMPLFHNKSNSLEPVVTWIISEVDYLGRAEAHGHKERTILNDILTKKTDLGLVSNSKGDIFSRGLLR